MWYEIAYGGLLGFSLFANVVLIVRLCFAIDHNKDLLYHQKRDREEIAGLHDRLTDMSWKVEETANDFTEACLQRDECQRLLLNRNFVIKEVKKALERVEQ